MAEMQQKSTRAQRQAEMQQRTMMEASEMQSVAAVGSTWFETAIAQRHFAGVCCQQVAGCCQRSSIQMPLEEMMQQMRQQQG